LQSLSLLPFPLKTEFTVKATFNALRSRKVRHNTQRCHTVVVLLYDKYVVHFSLEGALFLTEHLPLVKRHVIARLGVGRTLLTRMARRAAPRVLLVSVVLLMLLSTTATTTESLDARAADGATGEGSRDPRWTQYTRDSDMLASNDTRAIWVNENELWFGGENGFSHYNGVWASDTAIAGLNAPRIDGSGLAIQQPLGQVQAFVADSSEGILWAGSSSGLLLRWDGQVWSLVADVKSAIHALVVTEGQLWIGTDDGLYRFDGVEDSLVDALGRQPIYSLLVADQAFWAGTASGLWRYRESRWSQVSAGESNLALGVYAMALSPDGKIVVGTAYGIGWQPGSDGHWVWYETLDENGDPALIQSLAFDHTGVLWAGSDGAGAFSLRLDRAGYTNYGYTGDVNLTTRFVRQIAVDRDNSIWFATPAGVFRYQVYRWINDEQGSADDVRNHINDLLIARDGALWAVTGGAGVRRKASAQGPETVFTAADGVVDAGLALAQDARGAIWVGGIGGLFRYVDGGWQKPAAMSALPSQEVTSLAVDDLGLWIGTTSGLAYYSVTTDELRTVKSLDNISVEALAMDNLGRVWAGTQGAGIWVRELDGRWRQFLHDANDASTLPGDQVYSHSLAADPQVIGGMWAIVDGSELVHWDGFRWQRSARSWPLPSNLLWTIYTDPSDGSLWVGSEAGVTRYDGMTWHTFGANDGLQSAVIYAVVRTSEGAYWFGGSTGLTYFLPDQTPPWVQLGPLAGEQVQDDAGLPLLSVGQDVLVHYAAGDLQTAPAQLRVLQRVGGPKVTTPWVNTDDAYVRHHFDEPGIYTFELLARDESFNYSDVATLRVKVVEPPAMVTLPGLGAVEIGVFRTLAALGALIVLGSAYMAFVILGNRRRALEALARGFNPYISGEPVRRDDMFFGRRALLQRIVDTLHSNSIMIHGERRIGKTSLLLNLMTALREVNDPEYWFVPVYIDLEGTPQEGFFQLLIDEVLENVDTLQYADAEITPKLSELRYYTKLDNSYTDRDFNRDLNRITETLEEYGDQHEPGKQLRLILLIDEMDVMSGYDRLIQQQLRRIFMREFAATLGAVVAGIQISKEWDRVESPWFNLFNDIALTPFTREQAIELLVEPVRGYYQYDPAAVEFILDHANGRPYKIQQYGLEAVNHMLAARRRRITLADVEAAHRRLEAAERAGVPSGNVHVARRTLLNRLHDVVRQPSPSAGPENGETTSHTQGRGGF
jgi:ligand-binding sensor domain-containing protein